MNFRSLFLIILMVLVCAVPTLQVLPSAVPHGFIGAWTPGSYGSFPGVAHQRPPLPIWVQIAFDRTITDDFAINYCLFLRQSNSLLNIYGTPKKHGVTKNYVIVVDPSITQEQLKIELEKANRHFDPDMERQEKLKIEKAMQAARELEQAREQARQEKIAKELRLQKEAEQRKIELEEARKAQAVEVLRLQDAKLQKEKEIEEAFLRKEAEKAKMIADSDPMKQTWLKNAILRNSYTEVVAAIKAGANLSLEIEAKVPLWYVVTRKKSKAVEALLDCGVDINAIYEGQTPVLYAIKLYDAASAISLIKKGANLAAIDYVTLQNVMVFLAKPTKEVTRAMVLELLIVLVNHDCPLSDWFLLDVIWTTAIKYESEKTVEFTLKKGANPNQRINSNSHQSWFDPIKTPLSIAITEAKTDAVRVLLEAGANPNCGASFYYDIVSAHQFKEKQLGWVVIKPLKLALQLGFTDIADLLIEYGAVL